jgi:hypothetical protein
MKPSRLLLAPLSLRVVGPGDALAQELRKVADWPAGPRATYGRILVPFYSDHGLRAIGYLRCLSDGRSLTSACSRRAGLVAGGARASCPWWTGRTLIVRS